MTSSKRKSTRGISQFTTKKSKHRPTLLDTVKIENLLGKGVYGTVFLATDKDNNRYAFKIEKLLKEDVKKSLKSPHWRELYFVSHLASKHPDQFLQLYDSRIINKCTFKQTDTDYNELPELKNTIHAKLAFSPYCSLKLWSFIDGDLQQLLDPVIKISDAELSDIHIQIVNIVDIMQSAGFLHNDFHWGNIACTRVAPSTKIEIRGRQIPTHGYIMKAIDYGKVVHKSSTEVHVRQTHDSYDPKKAGALHKFKVSDKLDEQLIGGQKKLDKNHNGKLDSQDFKILRKEEVDEINMPLNEAYDADDYEATHEKSQFGGYRAKLTNKKTGKDSYLGGTAYHKPEHAEGEAKAYKDNYRVASGKVSPGASYAHDRAVAAYRKSAKEAGHIREGWDDMLASVKKNADTQKTSTATKHDVKKTATGTVYTKQRDADGMSKEFKRDNDQTKRGRGRPKKNSFGEAAEFLMSLTEEQFDEVTAEGFDIFFESFENINK